MFLLSSKKGADFSPSTHRIAFLSQELPKNPCLCSNFKILLILCKCLLTLQPFFYNPFQYPPSGPYHLVPNQNNSGIALQFTQHFFTLLPQLSQHWDRYQYFCWFVGTYIFFHFLTYLQLEYGLHSMATSSCCWPDSSCPVLVVNCASSA